MMLFVVLAYPSLGWAQNALSYTTKGARSSANDDHGNMHRKTITAAPATMNDMSPPAKPAEANSVSNAEDGASDDPVKRIWRKYKALAAGEPEDADDQMERKTSAKGGKSIERPQKPEMPAYMRPERLKQQTHDQHQIRAQSMGGFETRGTKTIKADPHPQQHSQSQPSPQQQKSTGFAAILEQYHKTKEERRGMRAITVNSPDTIQKPAPPETIKPSAGEAEKPEAP